MFHPVAMIHLKIFIGLVICCSVNGSLYTEYISGRSLYRPSMENKPIMGTDAITKKKLLDVLFVVDISRAATITDLKNFIIHTTRVLELEATKAKIGVLSIPLNGAKQIKLKEGMDHKIFINLVKQRLTTEQQLFDLNNVPKLIPIKMSVAEGGRADAKKIVIIVAASFPSLSAVKSDLISLKNKGYIFFIVGLTQNSVASIPDLKSLVKDPKTDHLQLDAYRLLTTDKINEAIIKACGRDPCLPNLCTNRGECVSTALPPGYKCNCPVGRKGTLCQLKDKCNPNPCNGGICVDPPNDPKVDCTCLAGRTGDFCEKLTCTSNYCKNNGKCNDISGKPICKCVTRFLPPRCEKSRPNPCNPTTCKNGATCKPSLDWRSQTCRPCKAGFTGRHCETPVVKTYCQLNPTICQNNGKCSDWGTTNNFMCDCSGTKCGGKKCQMCQRTALNSCSPNPCKGDCVCQLSNTHESGYKCISPSGLLGKDCSLGRPAIQCLPTSISIALSAQTINGYQQGQSNVLLIVGPQYNHPTACSMTRDASGNYQTTIPLSGCGSSSVNGNSGITEVSNSVWLKSVNTAFDFPIPIFKFTCRYELNDYKVVTSLKPGLAVAQTISSKNSLRPTVTLCKSASCPQACPASLKVSDRAIYTVGQKIHLELALGQLISQVSASEVTSVHQLTISCSSVPNVGTQIILVSAGCLTNSPKFPIELRRSGISDKACVSIKVPVIKTCSEIYIRAHLQSCASSARELCPDRSSYSCATQTGKRKRRNTDEDGGTILIGPLVIVNGSRGLASVELYMNNKHSNVSVDKIVLQDDFETSAFPAVGTTMLWIILIVVVGLSLGLVLRLLSLRRW
uniref:uncharacterized protein LOC120339524 n=1 Tax=Styela clava TaxID=7725 RepID=UPI00193AB6A2|nr:uncharacterized protein LOC120339524 [Styela clava]